MSCSDIDQPIDTALKHKIGCTCKDGTYVVWNDNLMRQTGWTTGNPCYDKGGIESYVYAK